MRVIFHTCSNPGWADGSLPGGDPTLLGWLTTLAYFGAAALCAACAWNARRIFPGRRTGLHRLVWAGMSAGLLFLGANKELDLQSPLIAFGRQLVDRIGGYALRQSVQTWFVLGLIAASLLLLLSLAWILRDSWRQYWPLLLAILFLARFITVRAVSFFRVPLPPLSRWTGGFRANSYLELLGILIIGLLAGVNLFRMRSNRDP